MQKTSKKFSASVLSAVVSDPSASINVQANTELLSISLNFCYMQLVAEGKCASQT
jgi:hypothetical protein